MKNRIKILLIVIFASGLVLIRQFEARIFYDPLLEFFKTDHSTQPLPQMEMFNLYLNIILRFLMNTILSLVILWVAFGSKSIIKLSALLYTALFMLFFTAFVLLVNTSEAGDHMALFYVRRFLIQPLFLLLLLPAFYFHRRS
ncbi:MAG: exosortase F system-associated protein [Flavobacterium sp.]|nr:MAG: exosortase F system-associated protein [Flavobacterium sp.]